MADDPLKILKHQLVDENPQNSWDEIQAMTKEEALAYTEAEGTNTTEEILKHYDDVKNG